MKRLKVSLRNANLSTYVDLFVNHGSNPSFPWLLAHYFNFFGNFDDLQALDTLLTHRRGFNLKVGSKIRKIYFSDVNRILMQNNDIRVSYIQTFKPSNSLKITEVCNLCTCVLHDVSEVESYEIIEDDFDPLFDQKTEKIKKEGLSKIRIEDLTEENKNFKNFFRALFKHSEELNNLYNNADFKNRVLKIKSDKKEKINKIEQELELFMNEKKNIIVGKDITFERDLIIFEDGTISELLIKTVDSLINFLKYNDYVMEPLVNLAGTRNPLYKSKRDSLNAAVNEYFRRKKEKDFKTKGEIEHMCKKYRLKERVDYYNEQDDLKEEMRIEALKMSKSERMKMAREYREKVSWCEHFKEELSATIKDYDLIDSKFNDPEVFSKNENIGPLLLYLRNKECEMDIFWGSLTKNIDRDIFKNGLINLKRKIETDVGGFTENFYTKAIKELIAEVYDEEREYILEKVNNNENIDLDKLNQDYSKIVEGRKKYVESCSQGIFRLEGLCLNAWENENLEKSIKFLKLYEKEYVMYKEYMDKKTSDLIYCKQNMRIMYERHGIKPDISEREWVYATHLVNKKIYKYEETIKNYEENLSIFEEICGVSPYGIIIGGIRYVNLNDKYPKHDKFFYKENWQYETVNEMTEMAAKLIEEGSNVSSSYLKALKNDYNPNLDFYNEHKIEILQEEISKRESEIKKLSVQSQEENIYNTLFIQEEDKESENPVVKKEPMIIKSVKNKIENDYKCRILKRKLANKLFIELTTKTAINSSNIYEELEVEEAIVTANETVDKVFLNENVPYHCYDFKKYRKHKVKKIDYAMEKSIYSKDKDERRKLYSVFDIENNSNANKKYNVCGVIAYTKMLAAFRLLKLHTTKCHYTTFNFKKCQSKYLINSMAKLVDRMIKSSVK